MKKKLSILLALMLVAVSLFTVTAMAADGEGSVIYVNAAAENDGDGTKESPYKSLDTAVDAAPEGTTIILQSDCELSKGFNKTMTFTGTGKITINKQLTSDGEGWMCFGLNNPSRVLTFDGQGIEVEWNSEVGTEPWLMLSLSGTLNVTNGATVSFNFNSDTSGIRTAIYMNSGSAINVTNGSTFEINGYNTSGKEGQAIQLDEASAVNINVTGNSTFLIDGTNRGYVASPNIRVIDSNFAVKNCTNNGSNGGIFYAKNSEIRFENNAVLGLSTGGLTSENSDFYLNDNGYSGLIITGESSIDGESNVYINGNCENSYAYGAFFCGAKTTFMDGAVLEVNNNYANGIRVVSGRLSWLTNNAGELIIQDGVSVTITGNNASRNSATNTGNYGRDDDGGGIWNNASIVLPANAVIYNNHAAHAGDDIYNTGNITFGTVGTNWYLDGDPDCYHRIDGWYDDSNGSRWEAHADADTGKKDHTVLFDDFDETTGLATITGLKALKAAHGVLDEDADKVSIRPADITIYMGADGGYESVIPGEGGNAQESEGLPEPGYYITLPDWVNARLQGDKDTSGAVDLSTILTFKYDLGVESRVWNLERYHKDGASEAYDRYVYRLVPGADQVNVRLEFKDEDGNITTSESFAPAPGTLHQEYTMTIYPGALQRDQVNASIEIGDNSHEFDVIVEPGKLTIRGVTGEEDTVSLNGGVSTESGFAASVPEDTTYTINGSDIGLNDPSGVQLLVDELVQHEDDDITQQIFDAMTDRALEAISAELGNVNTDFAYMNLVDTNNGNVYVTANNPVTVTWPYPAGTDSNDTFYIVHFTDMNRGIDLTEGAIASATVESLETENTENGIRFTVNSFSPFVLVWSDEGGGWNPPDIDDDKPEKPGGLNTENHVAYIIGYPDGEVKPEGNITRAEVATIFFRLLTDETRDEYWSKTNSYTDVPADSWFNNAISTLSNMGIIDGYADGSFRPDAPITRAEFTKIAVSFFEYADYVYENTFTDVRSGSWYTQFIAAAVEIGLIEGYPDGTFRPDNYITRAEACTIVNRTLNRAPDEDHLLPESVMITWPDNQPGTWYYADMQEATNSHDYDWLGSIEDWTEKLEERDWEALEKLWSDSHDAPGGEVMS